MAVTLPAPSGDFPELVDLLTVHHEATEGTTQVVHDHGNRSAGMAFAASQISANYRESDAFASATVTTVNNALSEAGVAAPPGASGGPPSGTVPDGEGF
jgi:hypothetical protein